jgi:hypothetical protein
MLEGRSPLAAWCDPQQVRRLVEQVACGVAGADHHLYKLLAVSSWYERCIESRLGTT